MPSYTLDGQTLPYGPFSTGQGADLVNHPAQVLDVWTDEELAAIGVVRTPDPAAPSVPQDVSRRNAKLALLAAGKLSDVETAVAAADQSTQIYWSDSTEFHRTHPILLAIAEAISLTSDEIDALFVAAAAIS
jgi:hypothetical protein